jgi:asparagine synthase (glutamine-hydrolysing)
MAVGLETRVPMLDHRVVELGWRLPPPMRARDGQGKWLLRHILHRHVPAALVDRPKTGFALPVGSWLRGPLRAWAEDLLDERRLRQGGFLDPLTVRETWRRHRDGTRDAAAELWVVLMFQAFLDATGAS